MIFILVVLIGLTAFICFFITSPVQTKQVNIDDNNILENNQKPKLKTLTTEQIEQIHSKGMLTPAEKVEEWESFDLCAPGDAIGSAAYRCKRFRNCHDCLVDFANQRDEYKSIIDSFKITNKV